MKSQVAWCDSVVHSPGSLVGQCGPQPEPSFISAHRLSSATSRPQPQGPGVARPLPPAVTWTQVIISPFQAAALPHPVVPRHQPESCCRIQLSVSSSMVTIHLMGYHQEHMHILCFFSLMSRSLRPSQHGQPWGPQLEWCHEHALTPLGSGYHRPTLVPHGNPPHRSPSPPLTCPLTQPRSMFPR